MPHLRCNKPGHDRFMLFLVTDKDGNPTPEDQATIDSVRACEKCKDKMIVMIFGYAAGEAAGLEKQPEPKPEPPVFEMDFGKQPEEPLVLPAPWLRGILTIGDD